MSGASDTRTPDERNAGFPMAMPSERLFLVWFAQNYQCGIPEPSACQEVAAYLQGIADGQQRMSPHMQMAINFLKAAGILVETLRRYEVEMEITR